MQWIKEDHVSGASPVAIPPREPRSIRRTSSIEMRYDDETWTHVTMTGHARDLLTRDTIDPPEVLTEDSFELELAPDRTIAAIKTDPALARSGELVGQSAMRGFRKVLKDVTAGSGIQGRPLALLLDDIVGAAVVSGWIITHWDEKAAAKRGDRSHLEKMRGACVTYRDESSLFTEPFPPRRIHPVPPITHLQDDAFAFHPLPPDYGPSHRRVRRIDLWRLDDQRIAIDLMFQDSGIIPDGRRIGIHEYRIHAVAEGPDLLLRDFRTDNGVLPHVECLTAPLGLEVLRDLPLRDLDEMVLLRLRGAAGCTHLNDAMRGLSGIAALVEKLP